MKIKLLSNKDIESLISMSKKIKWNSFVDKSSVTLSNELSTMVNENDMIIIDDNIIFSIQKNMPNMPNKIRVGFIY